MIATRFEACERNSVNLPIQGKFYCSEQFQIPPEILVNTLFITL